MEEVEEIQEEMIIEVETIIETEEIREIEMILTVQLMMIMAENEIQRMAENEMIILTIHEIQTIQTALMIHEVQIDQTVHEDEKIKMTIIHENEKKHILRKYWMLIDGLMYTDSRNTKMSRMLD